MKNMTAEEQRIFNQGVRAGRDEMKNVILEGIEEGIDWVGPGRKQDLSVYITKKYMELK